MSNGTKITLKRSTIKNLANDDTKSLDFGEPLIIDNRSDNSEEDTAYLVIGDDGGSTIPDSIFFRGMRLKQAQYQVTYIGDEFCAGYDDDPNNLNVITDLSGNYLKVKKVSTNSITDLSKADTDKYYILCEGKEGDITKFDLGDIGIYIDNRGVMHGAAWNDYAETRHFEGTADTNEIVNHVVCEDGHGNLVLSEERLQPCSYVISDNYGMTIGEGNVHVAVAGKCLVCIDDQVELGDCVTAGEDGKASKMARQEIINYPDRILGTVVEVPEDIDGKVWIKVN